MHTQFWLVLFKQFRAYPIQTPNPKIKHNVDTRLKLLLLGLSSGHNWLRARAFIYCNIYFALYSNNLQLLSPTTKRQFITISHHVGACNLFFLTLDEKLLQLSFNNFLSKFVSPCQVHYNVYDLMKKHKMVTFKILWLMYQKRLKPYHIVLKNTITFIMKIEIK